MQILEEGAAAQPHGTIDLVDEEAGPVLRLQGEVDTVVVALWNARNQTHERAPVAVDVSAATFLDARGLRLVVRETEAARRTGRLPELRRPSPTVRRLVDIAGATRLFATVA
ncbi:STAS domain-containing protein [Blastococcus capsensis]|uniref:STAS domain-containing protein n=1 Tax=Blastococcus capsensis TaxID=1564163 RepID=UPI002541C73D|nr:STAS domain-containing protein [Blastococcus capsensis]MDK3258045.1 STAS domain-containing protein [Blastococcus capsensis]MDK3258060.1 STAS domain-containing protein [Blastococcus capsensis]